MFLNNCTRVQLRTIYKQLQLLMVINILLNKSLKGLFRMFLKFPPVTKWSILVNSTLSIRMGWLVNYSNVKHSAGAMTSSQAKARCTCWMFYIAITGRVVRIDQVEVAKIDRRIVFISGNKKIAIQINLNDHSSN